MRPFVNIKRSVLVVLFAAPPILMLWAVTHRIQQSLPYHRGHFADYWFYSSNSNAIAAFKEMGIKAIPYLSKKVNAESSDPAAIHDCVEACQILSQDFRGTHIKIPQLETTLLKGTGSEQAAACQAMKSIGLEIPNSVLNTENQSVVLSELCNRLNETNIASIGSDVLLKEIKDTRLSPGIRLSAFELLSKQTNVIDYSLLNLMCLDPQPSIRMFALGYIEYHGTNSNDSVRTIGFQR